MLRFRLPALPSVPSALCLASLALLAHPARAAQTVVFNDTFDTSATVSSTINSTAPTPANPSLRATAYQQVATKVYSPAPPTVTAGHLKFGIVSTSSGLSQVQGLFTKYPVTLTNTGDYVELTVVFTNQAGLFNAAANNALYIGLFNGAQHQPFLGGQANSTATLTNGVEGWQGYGARTYVAGSSGNSNAFLLRPTQSSTAASNQDLFFAYTGVTTLAGSTSNPTQPAALSVGSQYTQVFRVTKSGAAALTLAHSLYSGAGTAGTQLLTQSTTTSSILTAVFDGFAFGYRAAGSVATAMDVNSVTVTTTGTVLVVPAITTQPLSQTKSIGDSLTLSVVADGGAGTALQYQWQKGGVDLAGATSETLTLASVSADDAGNYTVVVTDTAGSTTSAVAQLTVTAGAVAPQILTPPVGATILVGGSATFSALASGTEPITYQWQRSADNVAAYANVPGATTASLALVGATLADAGYYQLVVTNGQGSVTTTPVLLTVNQAPAIVTQPVGATLSVGSPLTLSVTATGTPTPSYQWYRNGAALSGATAATYSVASVTGTHTGAYSVVVGNGIGSAVTSSTVSVAVLSTTMAPTAATPAPGATALLPDTRLTITFNTAPTLGTGGTITLFDAANDTAVDTIDLVAAALLKNSLRITSTLSTLDLPVATKTIGGVASWNYYPLTVSGNTVTIHPRNGVLAYGKSYYVQITPGAFLDSTGLSFAGIADKTTWTFATTATTPASPTQLTVAADGSGDFHTVQAAIDAVPAGNTTPTRIFIKNGTYFEIVYFTGKHHLTLRGEDATQTRIVFPSNNTFNGAGPAYHRGTFFANAVHDVALSNLTIQNSTPQGGSQAEALILSGTATAGQNLVTRCNLFSYQDTLQVNGQAFISDSRIEGDVDFLWGTGPVFFSNCTIKMLRASGGYFAQVRNPATNHGYVFDRCRFIAIAGSTANFLNRIDPNAGQFPSSEVVLVDCQLGDATNNAFLATAVGNSGSNYTNGWWLLNNATAANQATLAANVRNWDSGTTDANGAVADYTGRVPFTTWAPDATALANYRNPAWVLGTTTTGAATASTWTPAFAPFIVAQPASATVSVGASAAFTVDASAAPAATYQWQKDNTDLPGATAATYTIASASGTDAGSYTVTIASSAGSVTSSAATLTVNALPVAPAIMTQPASQAVTVGTAASFTVVANGTPPLTYQWRLNGTDLPTATAATLSFASAQLSDAGNYTVVVTNSVSSVTSNVAALTVNPVVTLPVAPVANAATGLGNNGFTASWTAVGGATGYRLDVSTDGAFGTFVTGYQDLDIGTNLSRAVTGLTTATVYSYRVRAVNSAGASASSNVITATTTNRVNVTIVAAGTTTGTAYSLTGAAYTQTFDTLPLAAFTWVNDSTLPGWYALNTASTFDSAAVISDGSGNLADLKIASLGTASSTERALAYHTRVNTAPTYLGLAFTNASGQDLNSFTLSYTPEQWKEGTDSRTLTFTVQYRVGAAPSDLNATSGWTTLNGLAATTLAGSAGKTATLTASAIPVTLPAGATIWFRWITANTATSSTSSHDTLAVDNVSVAFTAAPVTGAPVITTQPASQTVNLGTDVTLSVAATSETALTYQWKKAGVDLPGATAASLVLAATQVADSGVYTVVVTNPLGSVLSSAATLTVTNIVTPPAIATQPLSQTVNSGDTVTFTVVATGTAPLTYQWKKNSVSLANALAETLTLPNVAAADAASYTVVVTNAGGSVTSTAAVLTLSGIDTPPSFVTQSGSQSVVVGGTVSLSVVAAGTQPFTYQWSRNTVAVAGATGSSLTLTNIALADAGSYAVTVANTAGNVTSDPIVLTVTEPPTTSAGTLFVAPDGLAGNPGTFAQPTTLANAIALVPAGGTIYVRGGTYPFSTELDIARGNNGAAGQLKRLFAYTPAGGSPEKPVLDFSTQPYGSTSSVSNPRGLWLAGNFWHLKGLEVKGAADNGIYVAGNSNLVERCVTHANRDTGLQIGRYSSTAPSTEWPSDNLILNCESYDNNDSAPNSGENADGFACKLTSGPGNVFRGCIGHHNIDDGWDLFTKSATGPIGSVTIDQCIAYSNGTLTDGTQNPAGDKNGFKLGGESIAVPHYVSRCLAFNNGKNGFTWNSNPGAIVLVNNLAWDNVEGNYKFDSGAATFFNNVSLWTTSTGPGNRTGISDRYAASSGAPTGTSNLFWFTGSSARGPSISDSSLAAYLTSFVTLTVPTGGFTRHADGSINLADFARPVSGSPLFNAGVLPPTGVIAQFPFATNSYYENAPDLGAVETYLASPPAITSAPAGQSVLTGAAVTLSVSVSGTAPFSYQWTKDTTPIPGATASAHTIAAAQVSDSGNYTVTVTNAIGSVTSTPVTVTVAAPTAPTITTQPTARTVNVGTATTFTVAASGTSPFSYQWAKDTVAIGGAISSSYTIAGVQAADAGSYTVVVTNSVGSATSNAAVLTVDSAAIPPTITTQPASATVVLGSGVTFGVVASGSAPFAYQWKKGGTDLANATAATLSLSNVQAADAGSYTVVVTNAGGSLTSTAATLTVNSAPDTVYIADAFADGTRGGQSLPTSAAWWTSSGASNFTATPGAATQVVSSARTILAYFTSSAATPVTLALNQKLTFEFVVQFTGFDSAAGAGIANLRIGLLRSPGAAQRFGVDFASGQPATGEFTNYTGYAALAVANATGDAAPVSFGVRDQAQLGLLNNTLAFTTPVNGTPAASPAMVTGTDYRVTFVVTRSSAGNVLSCRIARASDSAVILEHTVTDPATTFTAFDTAALYFGKASSSASYSIVLKSTNVALSNLAIPSAPAIATPPASQSVGVGSNVTFAVTATGTAPFTYQWHKGTSDLANATSATLTLTDVQLADAGDYSVTVTNSLGSADSAAATLTVTAATAPAITTQPQSATVTVGSSASFSVLATGTAPFAYAWKHGTTAVGANASTLTLTAVQDADAGAYTVTVTNSAGSVTSDVATLSVNPLPPQAPAITTQPASQAVAPGTTATFSVVATGTPAPTYQWKQGGSDLSGATASTLTLTNVQASDAGNYTVTVANSAGSVTSVTAVLTVSSSVPVSAFNLTGFATVGTGTTGGGVIPETDAAYRKVATPQQFVQAIIDANKTAGAVKVIEILNDLNLGWLEVGATVQNLASNPLRAHATPKLHPTLIASGVSVLDIKARSPLTIFSASGATIKHVNFNVKGTTNIVIRNLKFDELWEWDESSKGNYDSNDWDFITLSNGGDVTHVWIDHCTFTKAYDGIVDLKAGTQFATLSWCKYVGDDGATNPNSHVRIQLAALEANKSAYPFYNFLRANGYTLDDIAAVIQGHDKGHLMGSNSLKTENDTLTATFHHQWLKNVWDRAIPRLRGGNVHDYNIFIDDTEALAARRMRDTKAALLSTSLQNTLNNTYSFRPFLNGAISTEGGSVLVEKSIYQNCLWPLRNNQTDVTNAAYTGKIKSIDSIYRFLNADTTTTVVRGDSTDAGNPMGPFQATVIPFAWDLAGGVLPYAYTADDPAQLESLLVLGAGAGTVAWSKDNWLKTAYVAAANLAPSITSHPQPRTVAAGVDATFTVQATGSGTLTYQWKKGSTNLTDGGRISGSNSAVLTLSAADASDVGSYTVVVTNTAGNITSNAAALSLVTATAPAIVTPPQSQSVLVGTDVSLTVVASGTAPLAYQWKKNDADLVGATGDKLDLPAVQLSDAASYTVVVTNTAGSATSPAATLAVGLVPATPTASPATGVTASSFTANWAAASGAASYRLDVSTDSAFGSFVTGYTALDTGSSLSAPVTGLAASTPYYYRVRAVNAFGASASSTTGSLTTAATPLTITTQPVSQSVIAGTNLTFSVAATSATPIGYQWKLGAASLVDASGHLAGTTTATLTITGAQPSDAGNYSVVLTNAAGTVTSATAILAVLSTPPAPVAVAPTNRTPTGFTANWSSAPTATGYRLDLATDAAFTTPVEGYADLEVGATLARTFTGLSNTAAYYYRVRATNAAGTSPSSNVVSAAPQSSSNATTVILDESFPLPTPDIVPPATTPSAIANVNAGLDPDANGFATPTATRAAWASFGTANITYYNATSLGLSAGAARGLMAYFAPSVPANFVSLAIGEKLTATVKFKYTGGTGAFVAGSFRLGLLNSGGGATNVAGAASRYVAAASNSLTGSSVARGYSGYIVSSLAQNAASADNLSFWSRTPGATGSQQIVGPSTSDLTVGLSSTFNLLGSPGGGAVGAIVNDGTTEYAATLSAQRVSATQLDLAYQVTNGSTTVMSSAFSQTSGTLVTSFDSLMIMSLYNASLSVTDLVIAKVIPPAPVAPTISVHPVDQTVTAGDEVTFAVAATGTDPLTYQWSNDSGALAGATGPTFTVSPVTTASAGAYRVAVSNSAGSVTSNPATLTVRTRPAIATQPLNHSVVAGSDVAFSVVATGTAPLAYQWKFNGNDLPDATSAILNLAQVQPAAAGAYAVVVTNPVGTATSTTAILTVTAAASAPVITTPPQSQAIPLNGGATLSVVATGTAPLAYQWIRDTTPIAGATASTLPLANVQPSDAGSYTVTVSNASGSATSAAAVVTVTIPAPTIVVQPQTQSALTGTRVSFSAAATGYGTLTYQWSKNNTPIIGATAASYAIAGLQADDAASYAVAIANAGGSTTSAAAVLTLATPAATLPTQPAIPAAIFRATDYGAVGDGTTDNAAAIQAAITAASNAGGGTVELPPAAAAYLSGPISLRSNINFQIDGGATLRVLPYGTYANAGVHFITVPSNSTNVALTGNGVIEGDGTAWWTADNNSPSGIARPRLVNVTRLTNVLVSGLTLRNSPQFHLAIGSSTNVTIYGLTITSPSSAPNTDGIDPSGFNFLIQGCSISVGDDNIAVKAGDACGNFMISDCAFGTGHGMSVGGQTNVGLDGMTVQNCSFTGTQFGIRLKADATQGGPVQNLTYANLTMTNVQYPILFYSYYNQIGSAGAVSGSSQTTPTKVNTWNTTPPNPLAAGTLPTWKNITVRNVTATGSTGYSIVWGLPLADALIQNVTFHNVSLSGAGVGIYDATNIQFTGTNTLPNLTAGNALAITSQPQSVTVGSGGGTTFTVAAVGGSGLSALPATFQWKRNGLALVNGAQPDGSVVSGATGATLSLTAAHVASAGAYTCTVSNTLDGYNTTTSTLVANSLPVSATSAAATLTVDGSETPLTIDTQPASQTVGLGTTASLSVSVTSGTAVTYQWLKDGSPVSGATSASLSLPNLQAVDAGSYTVVVTNFYGPVTSTAAVLTVEAPPLAPTATAATAVTTGGFTANWSASSGATSYRLDVATDSAFTTLVPGYADLAAGSGLALAVTGLADNTTYYYRLRATNAYGTGTSSNPIPVTTTNAHPASLLTTVLHEQFAAASVNAGLATDANGFLVPTSGQAVWYGGGAALSYVANNYVSLSAGSRGLLAYLTPSTSPLTLDVGETLTARITFKFSGGTGASSAGDFRVGLLSSNGHGGPTNDGASALPRPVGEPLPAARLSTDNFSLTAGGNTPRGYSGYVVNTTAANVAPAADSLSFWRRDGGQGRSQQWAGPTTDLAASATFSQLGGSGGGAVGAIANNGSPYVGTLSLQRTSATTTVLTYTVTTGTTTVMSYTVTETAGSPLSNFDTLFLFSTYNAAIAVTDVTVTKVVVPPIITTQPVSQSVSAGGTISFSVAASGSAPFTYQWKKGSSHLANGDRVSGATTATLTLTGALLADAGSYTVAVTNPVDTVTSNAATLTVIDDSVAPSITTQPADLTRIVGQTATFTVVAAGTPTPTYQWRKNTTPIDGATTATLLFAGVTLADAGTYDVVVTNLAGSVTSAAVTLTVNSPVAPAITTQPASQVRRSGQDATFTAVASGTSVTYQWYKDGLALSGATGATLTVSAAQPSDAGNYTVVVSNSVNSVTSEAAALAVITATHAVVGGGYTAGGTVTITNTLSYVGDLSGLGWQVLLPTGWSYASTAGQFGEVKPVAGTTALAEWAWTTVPASPITFTYTLNVPAGTTAATSLNAVLPGRQAGVAFSLLVLPDPLVVTAAPAYHSADTNRDGTLSLAELLRVIELYNTRVGTNRTGEYHTATSTTDDGFTNGAGTVVTFHSADYTRDGKLALSELLRVIELYNYRAGTQRTGRYHPLSAGEPVSDDGFAPGPGPL